MVKSLADELTDILNWVENPGLGEHAREEANAGLVIFCRGLVCGLRFGQQVTGNTPISVDEVQAEAFKPKWDPEAPADSMTKVDVGFRGGNRPAEEDKRIRPSIGEALKDPGFVPDCH